MDVSRQNAGLEMSVIPYLGRKGAASLLLLSPAVLVGSSTEGKEHQYVCLTPGKVIVCIRAECILGWLCSSVHLFFYLFLCGNIEHLVTNQFLFAHWLYSLGSP